MAQIDLTDLQAELMATFSVEAEEHLQAMNRHLLALEAGSTLEARRQLIAEIFRAAHSLKGAARAVSLPEVEALSHTLEDLFAGIREGGLEPAPDALQRAYRTLDSIGSLLGAGADMKAPRAEAPAMVRLRDGGDFDQRPAPARGSSVRLATDKLDALMAAVGELLVSKIDAERRVADVRALEAALDRWDSTQSKRRRRTEQTTQDAVTLFEETGARLHAARRELAELRRLLEADARRAAQITTDLQDAVRQTRMLAVSTLFEPLPRMVRDLARDSGKQVTLSISGGDTEVDRSVLERIKDPLTHLLRNAVDHGIEASELRAEARKPEGTISLSAEHRGDMLVIELADDGAGIDLDALRAGAVEKGLLPSAAAAELSDREAIALIFRSGFSTSPLITDLSGRGVGLDVVREAVELLHGSVEVESRRGVGTTFTLSLPLSVSTMRCLLVEAGGQTFALPVSAVERVMRIEAAEIGRAGGRETVRHDGRPVVVARLANVLGLDATRDGRDRESKQPVVVLGGPGRRAAFLVDRVTQTCEVVIKSLPDPLFRVRHLAGATVLGSGQVAMLLRPADLIAAVERARGAVLAAAAAPEASPATILVVEDSITTRTLEKNILQAAGYRVRAAADGGEGWSLLESGDCDLVLADVDMPVMNGFELTARIRADQRHRDLPVVLVTSLDAREDRERGIQAGADAYIVKGAFEQERLLDTIRRLI